MERLNPEDIQSLFDRYFDQALDEQGQALLAEYLRQDDDARERFIQEAVIQRTWQEWARFETELQVSEVPLPDEESRRLDEEVWQSILDDSIAARKRAEAESKAHAMLDQDQKKQELQLQSAPGTKDQPKDILIIIPRTAVWGAIAAALLLATWLVISVTSGPSNQTPNQEIASNSQPTTAPSVQDTTPDEPQPEPQPAPIVEAPPVQRIVATLTAERYAAWDRRPGEDLYAGQRFTLRRGFAEITTHDGSLVRLQAPSTIELIDTNSVYLHQGRMVGVCETQASKGLTIHAPDAKIVDVGTVFAVSVALAGTEVDVFRGEVHVTALQKSSKDVVLQTGEGASLSTQGGGIVRRDSSDQFVAFLLQDWDAPQVSGEVVFVDKVPADLSLGAVESNQAIHLYRERSGATLSSPLNVQLVGPGSWTKGEPDDPGNHELPAGTAFESYLVHFDPVGSLDDENERVSLEGQIVFPRKILAVMTSDRSLAESDRACGAVGTTYAKDDGRGRGIEPIEVPGGNEVQIEADGKTLVLKDWRSRKTADQIRVLIASEAAGELGQAGN